MTKSISTAFNALFRHYHLNKFWMNFSRVFSHLKILKASMNRMTFKTRLSYPQSTNAIIVILFSILSKFLLTLNLNVLRNVMMQHLSRSFSILIHSCSLFIRILISISRWIKLVFLVTKKFQKGGFTIRLEEEVFAKSILSEKWKMIRRLSVNL